MSSSGTVPHQLAELVALLDGLESVADWDCYYDDRRVGWRCELILEPGRDAAPPAVLFAIAECGLSIHRTDPDALGVRVLVEE